MWLNGQENASANIPPPPGLRWETGLDDKGDLEAPMKVHIGDACSQENVNSEAPLKVDEPSTEALEMENDALARTNAQLAWENAMLRQQSECGINEEDMPEWWPPQAWDMNSAWAAPTTQVGDLVYFFGLQNATELNDVYGVVARWDDDSQRWVVILSATGEEKFAKPENLMVVRDHPCYSQWYPPMYGMEAFMHAFPKSKSSRGKKSVSSTWSFASESTTASLSDPTALFGDVSDSSLGRTTVMMRNLPNDYSGNMVLEMLDEQGFKGCYNLMYLPMDYQRKAGFGYAFIDMISPEEAERFHQHFEGFAGWKVASAKVCCVGWSTLQGLQAHIERYRNSPVMHDCVPEEFKPMLFENGKLVPFPTPTKSIRAPRMRKTGGSAHKD